MKITGTILYCLLSLQIAAIGQTYPVTVSITTPEKAVKSGSEIRVNITVTNNSDETVRTPKVLGLDRQGGQPESANGIDVTDSKGQPLRRLPGHQSWLSQALKALKPGDSDEDFLILTKLFDLSKPGQYTVGVRHEIMEPDESEDGFKRIFVPSNSISITVTD